MSSKFSDPKDSISFEIYQVEIFKKEFEK